jgi:hypothetical protein
MATRQNKIPETARPFDDGPLLLIKSDRINTHKFRLFGYL